MSVSILENVEDLMANVGNITLNETTWARGSLWSYTGFLFCTESSKPKTVWLMASSVNIEWNEEYFNHSEGHSTRAGLTASLFSISLLNGKSG